MSDLRVRIPELWQVRIPEFWRVRIPVSKRERRIY